MKMENRTIWCDAIQFKVEQDSRKSNYLTVISSKKNVTEVNIPKTVTVDEKKLEVKSIDRYAFCNCDHLKSITIPDSVTSIGHGAFQDCKSLISIIIPDSVTSMDRDVFNGCDSVTIYCKALSMPCEWDCLWSSSFGPVVWGYAGECGITKDGFKYAVSKDQNGNESIYITGYDVNKSHSYYNDLSIPECILVGNKEIPVKFISEYAFRNCSLESLVIPSGVTSIGDSAFQDCENLTSITIPGSVTSIKGCLFYGCDNLCSITISDGVTTIEERAFEGLQSLASITIHASVTSIGDHAFQGCKSLTSITIPDSVTSIGNDAFFCVKATILRE